MMMIKVKDISKKYQDITALDHVSFEIRQQMIYGFIGKNGAGKSTCLHIISGFLNMDSGTIVYQDHQSNQINLSYLPEVPILYEWMTPYEYLTFLSKGVNQKHTERLIEVIDMKKHAHRVMTRFSRGMKQRVGIAAALIKDSSIVLLDEPTSALDPDGRRDVMNLMLHLKAQGKSIIFSSHILNDVENIADEILVIHQGKIVYQGKLNVSNVLEPLRIEIEFREEIDEKHIIYLSDLNDVMDAKAHQKNLVLTLSSEQVLADIMTYTLHQGLSVTKLEVIQRNLDDLLMEVTKDEIHRG